MAGQFSLAVCGVTTKPGAFVRLPATGSLHFSSVVSILALRREWNGAAAAELTQKVPNLKAQA